MEINITNIQIKIKKKSNQKKEELIEKRREKQSVTF